MMGCAKGHRTSLTAGTVMHRTRQDLVTWFHAAYLMSTFTPGISALQFQRHLGLARYETAYQMLHKLRAALVAPDREPLRGEVELDDVLIGGQDKDTDGRGGDKAVVFAAVEVLRWTDPNSGKPRSRSGRMRLRVATKTAGTTARAFAKDNITPGTLVRTDGLWVYDGLRKLGFQHEPVAQGRGRDAVYTLTHLDRVVSNLKSWLQGTHHGAVHEKHLQAYLNEYAFRFNRRFWRGPAFIRALGLATQTSTAPTYASLYQAGLAGGWRHPDSPFPPTGSGL